MSYPPDEIHRADQHYAEVENGLDQFIAAYRTRRAEAGRVQALDLLAEVFADDDPENMANLANLLAVAIDRLASR